MQHDSPWVLGFSASHNGAACLPKGDKIVCAIQEERLHRSKYQAVVGSQPSLSVAYCLQAGGITIADLDLIAFNSLRPMTSARQDILDNPQLRIRDHGLAYRRYSHHRCHAASAFALWGFDSSDILVIDGQGSEFGPRALGHRSIIADPRRADIKDHLNFTVKNREWFRPFAPSVLQEHAAQWFQMDGPDDSSPFMLRVVTVREDKRHLVPGIVHVDGTARIQTVTPGNGRYHDLIRAFHARTGVPMILNTSLNVMGDPMAETPDDALWCLLNMPLDFLALEDRLLVKSAGYSLSDPVPRLRPFSVAVPGNTEAVAPRTLPPDVPVQVTTATPWGQRTHKVRSFIYRHHAWLDGKHTNGEIVARINAETGSSVDMRWWQSHLRVMVRSGMVSFLTGAPLRTASGSG